MCEKWLKRLAPLGTDEHKPFLEIAPYLIVVFRINSITEDGETEPTYYSQESVGIAVGLLLAALHNAGLATLTHTPSPMKFLQEILRATEKRNSVCVDSGRLSGKKCESSGHRTKIA